MKHLPPRAPSSNGRPLSGCFQNRGRLFSTPNHHHLSDNCTQSTQTFSGHSSPQHHVPVQGSANHSVPTTFKNRRIQSAKARLETSTSQCIADTFACDTVVVPGSNIAVYDVNRNLALDHKPVKRRGSGKDSYLYTHEISAVRSASRPSSAKSGWTSAPVSPAVASEQTEELVPEDLKPSVYGYRLKRQVYGSNPDIFTPCQQPLQLHTMLKLDNRPNIPSEGDAKGDQSNSRGCGTRYATCILIF